MSNLASVRKKNKNVSIKLSDKSISNKSINKSLTSQGAAVYSSVNKKRSSTSKTIFFLIPIIIVTIVLFKSVYAQPWQESGGIIYPLNLDYLVGIGTSTPDQMFSVYGGNISIYENSSGIGGSLFAQNKISAQFICDENGANCFNLSSGWPSKSSLDAADGLPAKAVSVDNTGMLKANNGLDVNGTSTLDDVGVSGKIIAAANITSTGGFICDSTGCINNASYWTKSGTNIYFDNNVGIGAAPQADTNLLISKTVSSAVIEKMLVINPVTAFANAGGMILFDTGSSNASIRFRQLAADVADIEFVTPNAGVPVTALKVRHDGGIEVNGNVNVSGVVDVNGMVIKPDSISFSNGAKITTTSTDIIIKIP